MIKWFYRFFGLTGNSKYIIFFSAKVYFYPFLFLNFSIFQSFLEGLYYIILVIFNRAYYIFY